MSGPSCIRITSSAIRSASTSEGSPGVLIVSAGCIPDRLIASSCAIAGASAHPHVRWTLIPRHAGAKARIRDCPLCAGLSVQESFADEALSGPGAFALDEGRRPADLPIEQATRFEFMIKKTAKALSFDIPPDISALATAIE